MHAGFDIAKNVFFFMFISLAKDENPLDLEAYSLTSPLIQTQLELSHRIILFL